MYVFVWCQNGYTALMKAVTSHRTEIIELLLKVGADINVKNEVCAHVVVVVVVILQFVFCVFVVCLRNPFHIRIFLLCLNKPIKTNN